MKTLKGILVTLLIIIVLLAVIALFLPSKVHVERLLVIKAPAAVVFNEVNSLENWKSWSPWEKKDTAMVSIYSGPDAGKGAKTTWTSNNKDVGSGSMIITESFPDSMLKIHMDFNGHGGADATFRLTKVGDGTKVTWSMDSDMGWNLVGRYFGLMMDKWVGPDFESGLKDLGSVSEKAALLSSMDIKVEETVSQDMHVVTMNVKCTPGEISSKFKESYGKLMAYMQKTGLKETGAPYAIYNVYSQSLVDMNPGIPVDQPAKSEGDILAVEIKGRNVLKVTWNGPYSKMMPVYDAIPKYARDHNKQITGAPWEVYITDPMTMKDKKDSSDLVTEVYFPVK